MDSIIIDFSKFPFCFKGIVVDDFTNLLEDSNEFLSHFKYLICDFIPHFRQYTSDTLYQASKHCHLIKKDKNLDKYELILKIIGKILSENGGLDFETFYNNNLNDYQIWQLGLGGGLRAIGTLSNNIFSVLFFDYNHLIFPDEKNNQKDVKNNTFKPM